MSSLHPFGDVAADQIYDKLFAPLHYALPDVERRDIICLSEQIRMVQIGLAAPDIMLAGS